MIISFLIQFLSGFLLGYFVRGFIKYKPMLDVLLVGKRIIDSLDRLDAVMRRTESVLVEEKAESDKAIQQIETILSEYKTKL